jgi:hypothetical protein
MLCSGMARSALAVAVLAVATFAGTAEAVPTVARFAVTPSTTQADGHPNLSVSLGFVEPTNEVKDISLHLPAGLSVDPRAIPFCSGFRLARNLCASRSRAGFLAVTVTLFGLDFSARRDIFNVRPFPNERARLGVPILGTYSRPSVAAELPVVARPGDGGLDMAVRGLPSEVNGYPVRVKQVSVWLKGTVRVKIRKRKFRRRPVLTNPHACVPATSVLELTPQLPSAGPLTSSSTFTPTGCASPPPG